MPTPLMHTDLPLHNRRQGKVRDVYDGLLHDKREVVVMVATDRLSAFDVVMPTPVAGKGIVLTQLSRFWFDLVAAKLGGRLSHHLLSTEPGDIAGLDAAQIASLRGRVMIGRRCHVVPIECVVRGYLAGSGWAEYQRSQTVCGVPLPYGLRQCDKLPQPIFTPATKAATGHDENISFERTCEIIGDDLAHQLRDMSLAVYQMGHDHAAAKGIILADTKFEFGIPLDDHRGDEATPILIDEVMTPDSSRFWPADQYEPGRDQPSFDKQFVRNYLQDLVDAGQWHKTSPGPKLPDEIVKATMDKYLQAHHLLTGRPLKI